MRCLLALPILFLTCDVPESFESRMTPKYLTSVLKGIFSPSILIGYSLHFLLFVNITATLFDGLMERPYFLSQGWALFIACCIRFDKVDGSMPFIRITKSSANPIAMTPSHSLSSSSSSSNGTFQQIGESTPP